MLDPFLEFAFMRRALVGCLALSLSAPPLGVFLVLRRLSLIGDALGHAILPGVALGVAAFGLSLVYQLSLLFLLGVTSGVSWADVSLAVLLVTALLNMIVAIPAVLVSRALDLRFGEPERVAW